MLDILRQGARSWGIKLMFAMIIVVFVLAFGMGRMSQRGHGVLALVNGEPILIRDYQQSLQRAMDRLRSQTPGLSSELLESLDIRGQVFRQLVASSLLLQEARHLGLFVTDAELVQAIHGIPAFQDPPGTFSGERYRRMLQSQGLEPSTFEEDLRRDLLIAKLRTAMEGAGRIPEAQIRDQFTVTERTADLQVLAFAAANETVNITEDDIRRYHEEHREAFQEPAQARMRFLLLTPATLAAGQKVSEEEIQAFYAAHRNTFREPEAVHARHILRTLSPQANATEEEAARSSLAAIRNQVRDSASFAALAKKHSQDGSAGEGGDLGWFARGVMVPQFEEVAFALPVGHVSEIVRTPFGLHLIWVEEKRPARERPLEEVAAQIRATLARDKAAENLGDSLDVALEHIARAGNLDAVAQALGVSLLEPAPFSEGQAPAGLSIKPEDLKALMALAPGSTTQAPILLQDGYLLATKVEDIPARTRSVEEARAEIREKLTLQRQKEAAQRRAEAVRARLPELPLELRAALRTVTGVGRQGIVPGIGVSAELGNQALRHAPGTWLPQVYALGETYVLARVEAIHTPDDAAWNAARSEWIPSLRQQAADHAFQAFLKGLQDKATIEVLVPEIINPPRT